MLGHIRRIEAALGATVAFVIAAVSNVTLNITTIKPYKYGDSFMAEVTLPDGTNLSDALVAAGLAVFWDGTGPRPGG